VFQDYAIFPHMTVGDNVAFGLRNPRRPRQELAERVTRPLDLVRLGGHAARLPHQLSGGQQQRVGLARAVVIKPQILLMDEPLSNLDAKLRIELRDDIRDLQRSLGITTIYVTHDQEEALSSPTASASCRAAMCTKLARRGKYMRSRRRCSWLPSSAR